MLTKREAKFGTTGNVMEQAGDWLRKNQISWKKVLERNRAVIPQVTWAQSWRQVFVLVKFRGEPVGKPQVKFTQTHVSFKLSTTVENYGLLIETLDDIDPEFCSVRRSRIVPNEQTHAARRRAWRPQTPRRAHPTSSARHATD